MSLCPPEDDLERLLSESLSEAARTRVLDHVEECADCQKTLARLAESTPGPTGVCLLSALGGTSDVKSASEAAFFRQLKHRVRLPDSQTPEVDGFDIFEEIGRGAAAVVYRARHRDLGRFVALKVIAAGPQMPPQVRERFRREAEAIARFQHPNIVQVYSIGEQGDCLYLALELVEGGSLTARLGVPLPPREAARLIATLAAAIEYAHRQGVIHRDLKPANILLQKNDSAAIREESGALTNAWSAISNLQLATPKITDFGLAKLLPVSGLTEDRMTQSGAILGTPAYTAPEQAQGKAAEVGPTADIYSLGAILYELLTGRPPFQGTTAVETLVQVAHEEPVPPARLVPQVPRDLQTICLKCLEKFPHKRYATSGDLAADLERFLKDEPVLARPVGWGDLSLRWARRNKGIAAALLGVAMLLVLLATGSLVAAAYFQRQEEQQHILYLEKRNLADDKGRLLNEKEAERQKAVRAEERESSLRQLAEKQGEALRRNLYLAQMNLAGQAAASDSGIGRLGELLAPRQKDWAALRNWEWYYLYGFCHRDVLTLRGHQYDVHAVAWSPDGRQVASAGADGLILIWDAAEGGEMRAMHGEGASEARSLAWSPDGRRLVSAGTNGTVKIWDPVSCKEVLAYRGHTGGVCAVAWSPDGKRIVSGGADRTIHVWDFANGKNASVLRGHTGAVFGVAWSPDGKRIASAGEDSTVRLWDALTGMPAAILRGHLNWVNSVAWSPSGARLASVSNDRSLKIWDVAQGKEVLTLQGHAQSVTAVAWSPDGARLVTGSDDDTVKIWAATGGPAILTLRGHTRKCSAVAWSADGKRLASAASDATIKIWDTATGTETPVLQSHGSPIEWLAWRADSACFACASGSDTIAVWDRSRHQESFLLRGHRGWVRSVCWSADGKRLASGGDDQTIRIWDAARHNEVTALHGHTDVVTSVSWSADGTRLASASDDKTVRIWDAVSGKPLQICRGHDHVVHCVMWSPDNTRLASASWDGTVRVWDAKSGREVLCLRGHRGSISGVCWSRHGERLASAGHDGTIKIWDAATGDLTLTLRGHNAQVTTVDWNPDGTRLASSSWDRTVKIWDTETGKETLTLAGHEHGVNVLAWSPDGLTLVSGGDDETILVHDATIGYEAGLAPQYLSMLNRRLATNPTNAADWRLRGEIDAGLENWNKAAADFEKYLALDPRQHWVSLGYWVAGPYPEDLAKSCPPERVSFPNGLPTGTEENAAPPKWEGVPMNACGFVNFGALFAQAEHISAYALQRVYSPRQQAVAILLGSDDQIRLWLNGKQIHECLDQRTAMPDARAVPATLEAGWNTLLARVANVTGDHALYLRLSDSASDRRRAYEEPK